MNSSNGVQPLVCVVCGRVVGVINAGALAGMLSRDEAYFCHDCAEIDERWMELMLVDKPETYYPDLVSKALSAAQGVGEYGTAQ